MKNEMPFIVEMTSKRKIQIDADEVDKVVRAIGAGGVVRVKQGIIVGSMVCDIVVDDDRYKEFLRERRQIEEHNRHDKEYNEGKEQRVFKGLIPLKDIFENIPRLGSGS